MGCFNVACAVSGLSIGYNDEVVVVPISCKPNLYKHHSDKPEGVMVDMLDMQVYPSDRYIPVGFPIYGKYDDYGGVEVADESQYGYRFFKAVFDVEWENAFRPERLVKYKVGTGVQRQEDGIPLGWLFVQRKVWDSIVNVTHETWRGQKYTRENEVAAVLNMVQQGIDIRFASDHGLDGTPVPAWLEGTELLAKYKELGKQMDELRQLRKGTSNKELDDQFYDMMDLTRRANFECPYDGYKDALTGELIPRPYLAVVIKDEQNIIHFDSQFLVMTPFYGPRRNEEYAEHPTFKKQLKDSEWAVGFANAMWDLSMLFSHCSLNGVQYMPAFALGQFRNDVQRGNAGWTLFEAAWDKKVADINEGYMDKEEAEEVISQNIAKVEALLAKMKAEGAAALKGFEDEE